MAKSSKAAVKEKLDILHKQSRVVDPATLKAHPKNPNLGDVTAIKKSLVEFGQYRPVVVNTRNGFIAAGHHTVLAARELGRQVSMVEIDVDETTHLRIMLTDNRLAAAAQTDEVLLDEILQSLKVEELDAIGYTELDAEDLHTRMTAMLAEATAGLDESEQQARQAEIDLKRSRTFDGSPLGEEPEDEDEFDDEDIADEPQERVDGRRVQEKDAIVDADEEMNGGLIQFTPPEDLTFPGSGELEIPKLLTDPDRLMHFDEIPENLLAWAGSATKDWPDHEQWWLYNWGIDSTSGMRDTSKVIVSFYCFDEYFDNWWWYPERYAGKLVNSGIKYIVTPDYSMETKQSRSFSVWQLHRNRWLARYFQEIGMKIVPNISWKDGDELFLKKYVLATLPKNLPLIAMQMQTVDVDNAEGGIETTRKHYQMVLDTLEPQGLLLYVGKQAQEQIIDHLKIKCPVFIVENRMHALSEKAKQRQKKKGI